MGKQEKGDGSANERLVDDAAKEFRLVREARGAIALVVLFAVGAATLKISNLHSWLLDVLFPVAAIVVVMGLCALIVATFSTDRLARKVIGYTVTGLVVILLLVGTAVIIALAWRFINPPRTPGKPPSDGEARPSENEFFHFAVLFVDQANSPATFDGNVQLHIAAQGAISSRVREGHADFPQVPTRLLGRKVRVELDSPSVQLSPAEKATDIILQANDLQTFTVVPKSAFTGMVLFQNRPVPSVKLLLKPFGCPGTTNDHGVFAFDCPAATNQAAPEVIVVPPEALLLDCKSAQISAPGTPSTIELGTLCVQRSKPRPATSLSAKEKADCKTLAMQLKAQYPNGQKRSVQVGDGEVTCQGCTDLGPLAGYAHDGCDDFIIGGGSR